MPLLAAVITAVGELCGAGAAASAATWSVQPTPAPLAAHGRLSAVSCSSRRACTAVGNSVNPAGNGVTLAERRNGTRWRIQPTPNPTGARDSQLSGVSCTAASACTAVGQYVNDAGIRVTLAERWNSTRWRIQPTPNPAGAPYSQLSGVSCTAASACTAVGAYVNDAGNWVTLAERWNGTSWQIQPTPDSAGAPDTFSQLLGVSCTAASACTAVGHYGNDAGSGVTQGTSSLLSG